MPEDERSQTKGTPSRRGWRWIYYLFVLIVIVLAALYLTGHLIPGRGGSGTSTTTPPPVGTGYLASTATSVIFIQWNQSGTATAGVAQMDSVQNQPPHQTISVRTIAVTGQVNKSSVSVSFQGVVEVFGTVSGGGFILDFPQADGSLAPVTFRRASASDYNKALAQLRAQVNAANAAAPQTTPTS